MKTLRLYLKCIKCFSLGHEKRFSKKIGMIRFVPLKDTVFSDCTHRRKYIWDD